MRSGTKAALGMGIAATVFASASAAHAYLPSLTVEKCLAAKVRNVGKAAAAYTGCYAKAAAKNATVDGTCLGKAGTKLTSAFAKSDARPPCQSGPNDGPDRNADTAAFASDVNAQVGDGDGEAGKCDAAKQKLAGKYVAAIMRCYSKAATKGGVVDTAPGGCTDKALVKFQKGLNKAELKPPCTTSDAGALVALQVAANLFADAQTCALDPTNPACTGASCGNGVLDVGEDCDPLGGPATSCETASNTSAAIVCSAACTCACPTTLTFSTDPSAPESIMDTGWMGIGHRTPITHGDLTLALSGCSGSTRPCGTCTVSGLVTNPNAGAGQLDTRRCSTDTSVSCLSAAQCGAHCIGGINMGAACTADSACPGSDCVAAGTCDHYFGPPLGLATGGITHCVGQQFAAPVTGTADVETGALALTGMLRQRVYLGVAIDHPCPRCAGDPTANDDANDGTCDGGDRAGKACDRNGSVPGLPDFGDTSLDCPPTANALIGDMPIDFSSATNPVIKTLSAASPSCSGSPGQKCLCGTCNNANAEPCMSNADCPPNGGPGVCQGPRCISGPNNGAPCTVSSQCPMGTCTRPGDQTKPSSCLDDTTMPDDILDCVDSDADGEGECTQGPYDNSCSVASGHAQRGCLNDADCGGGGGSCETSLRKCFLTGGGSFQPPAGLLRIGTDTLIAVGMADAPMNDVSHPTLGAVACMGPSGANFFNVNGLPGPRRITIKGTAVALP